MLDFQLPDTPVNRITPKRPSGLIDTDEVTSAWADIEATLNDCIKAVDELEAAALRLNYSSSADASKIMQTMDGGDVADIQPGNVIEVIPAINTEFASTFYSKQPVFSAGLSSDFINLPVVESINALNGADITLEYVHGRSHLDSGIQSIKDGGIWRMIVKTNDITRLEPRKELGYVSSGVPCIFTVSFKVPQPINTISFESYSALPMDLVAIECLNTAGEAMAIVSPDGTSLVGGSTMATGKVELRFPLVYVQKLRFIINQRHYRRVESAKLNKVWYEYEYAIGKVFIGLNKYATSAQWVSSPIELPNDTIAVQIRTEEVLRGASDVVEYDISFDDKTWLPIAPEGKGSVRELITMRIEDGIPVADLRFNVSHGLAVYAGGSMLQYGTDYVLASNRKIVFKRTPSSPIVAVYVPENTAYEVPAIGFITEITEEFSGTDEKGIIRLSRMPYVDRNAVKSMPPDWDPSVLSSGYVPIKVSIYTADGKLITQPRYPGEPGIYNQTPYREGRHSGSGDINYTVSGKVIQFDTTLNEFNKIVVTYPSLPETVRIRAVLYGTGTARAASTTPIIEKLYILANRRLTF